ncbi:hypothetical protein C8A01DRAFT_33917 [Parachaetomium inaequale]|uniref:Uncharacterized protein n=1 Tax=Parachaetomium inaequale TaxID=2588326 RepID=A0AAN6PND9_9PEZI|nr:hypothetical protein C8A01DRAFT_33917 [Parachaetomium inaequale]
MAQRPTLILGVDLGVSTSSVSYRLLRHGHCADKIAPLALIRLRGDLTGSVPSELGSGPSDTWGHGVTPQHTRLKFLKLALVDPEELPPDPQPPSGRPGLVQDALNKIATEDSDTGLVAEYLKQTVRSLREAIEESGILAFGRNPATLNLIGDTEAAASTVRDTVLILDAGGGTVDIAAYTLGSQTPMAIDECIPSEGRFIGAVFMMEAFDSFARQQAQYHMGPDYGAVDQAALETEIEEAWETVQNVPASVLTRGTWSYWLDIQRLDHAPAPPARLAGHDIARTLRTITDQVVEFTLKQAYAVEVETGKRPKVVPR